MIFDTMNELSKKMILEGNITIALPSDPSALEVKKGALAILDDKSKTNRTLHLCHVTKVAIVSIRAELWS
jgi:hypothetical protein